MPIFGDGMLVNMLMMNEMESSSENGFAAKIVLTHRLKKVL